MAVSAGGKMKKYCDRAYQNDMVPQGKGSSAVSDNGGGEKQSQQIISGDARIQ